MTDDERLRLADELERACDFGGAARAALEGGDARRALRLAALAGDAEIEEASIAAIIEGHSRDIARAVAGDLEARGHPRVAGTLLERIESFEEAARAFAAAGSASRAAQNFERAGRPADAARILEATLRARPNEHELRLELAGLLTRHGRKEAAVKVLQAIARGTPARDRGLPELARLLEALGLGEAAAEVKAEMKQRGIDPTPAPVAAPEIGVEGARQVLLGRYEIIREVATTPGARVLEAIDTMTERRVALKILRTAAQGVGRDAYQRFEREARVLSQLSHPSVVELTAYHPEGPAMVLEWMPGGSLADLLAKEPIAPARAVEIAVSVLAALGEAHRLGILHRDVKPANVLFDAVGTPRLSDFGAAHLGDLSSTATAGAIGTFAYMSPEQRLGRPAGVASDLYAVGALLVEMLTGEGANPVERDVLDPAPSAFRDDLGVAHDQVVARLLAVEPADRPADAFEARRDLLRLSWPTRVVERGAPVSTGRRTSQPPAAPGDGRLEMTLEVGDGRDAVRTSLDRWLGRPVLVWPHDEAHLQRARWFARADHPSLPTLLRVDSAAGQIWVAPPLGRCVADEVQAVPPRAIHRLLEALRTLHGVGGVHGAIDVEHVYFFDGELTLAYPRGELYPMTPEADAEALEQVLVLLAG